MVSCLLRAVDPTNIRNAQDALTQFGNIRTSDGKGVTIPSQMRYVRYWDVMISDFQGKEPPQRTVKLHQLRVESMIKKAGSATVDLYFTIEQMGQKCFDSRQQSRSPCSVKRDKDGGYSFQFEEGQMLPLTGDIRFIFYHRNSLLADEELFHFWINTSLCQCRERLTKKEKQLDGRPAKGKDDVFHADLAVELVLFGGTQPQQVQQVVVQQPTAAAAQAASPVLAAAAATKPKASDSQFASASGSSSQTSKGGFFSKVFR